MPDLTRPDDAVTPPTAQRAQRQGAVLARNVAASLGLGRAGRYSHRDLGLVADLGGRDAVANPVGIPLTGLPAKAVTRAYHLLAVPGTANRTTTTTVTTTVNVVPGARWVAVLLQRLGADGADTSTGSMRILGAELLYERAV